MDSRVTFCHIFLQRDGVFQGQSHGVEELVSGFIPDHHPPGFYPPGDVDTDVLYFVHSNVYRKMRLPFLDRRKLRGRERCRIYFDQSPVKSCFVAVQVASQPREMVLWTLYLCEAKVMIS